MLSYFSNAPEKSKVLFSKDATTEHHELQDRGGVDNESIQSLPDDDIEPIEFSDLPKYESGLPKYRQPNYKPLVLEPLFLIVFNIWLAFCIISVTIVSVLGYLKPTWWHLGTVSGHAAWVYVPGIIAATTSIIFSAVLNQYFNIKPYAEMANVDLDKSRGVDLLASAEVAQMEPGGNIMTLFHFVRKGFYLAALLIFNFYGAAVLTVLKSAFIQPTKDGHGWAMGVSYIIGFITMILYLLMFISTVWIYIYFRTHITGLRWSPNSIASRIALVQGSNVLTAFRKTEIVKSRMQMSIIAKDWANNYGLLRIGYWKNTKTGLIFHGLRFVNTTSQGKTPVRNELRGQTVGKSSQRAFGTANLRRPSPTAVPNTSPRVRGESDSRPHQTYDHFSDPEEASPSYQFTPRPSTEHSHSHTESIDNGDDEYNQLLNIKTLRRSERKETWRGMWVNPEKALHTLDEDASVQRISNVFLSDAWIFTAFLCGLGATVATLVFIGRGRIDNVHTSYFMDDLYQIPHIFTFLPALLLAPFNIVFVSSDLYHRAMLPIQNMSKLPNAATAKASILLDYISSNPVTAFLAALAAQDWKIAWGIFLANSCGYSYVVFARVFIFEEDADSQIQFQVNTVSLYGSLVILIGYCVAILIARPRGAVRSCWPIYNLLWTTNLCYESPVLRCPEFWAQGPNDDYDHLEAQVILADRSYAFGLHKGLDEEPHLGIGSAALPVWDILATDVQERLDQSTKVARGLIKAGCYDGKTYESAQIFLETASETWKWEMFVWQAPHYSWKAWMSERLAAICRRNKIERPNDVEANLRPEVTVTEEHSTVIRRHVSDQSRTSAVQPVDPRIPKPFARRPVPGTVPPTTQE